MAYLQKHHQQKMFLEQRKRSLKMTCINIIVQKANMLGIVRGHLKLNVFESYLVKSTSMNWDSIWPLSATHNGRTKTAGVIAIYSIYLIAFLGIESGPDSSTCRQRDRAASARKVAKKTNLLCRAYTNSGVSLQ